MGHLHGQRKRLNPVNSKSSKTSLSLEFEILVLGDTPYGGRCIVRLETGSFEGSTLKGAVLPGGGGWIILRRDNVLETEVRAILETDDKQQIYMRSRKLANSYALE